MCMSGNIIDVDPSVEVVADEAELLNDAPNRVEGEVAQISDSVSGRTGTMGRRAAIGRAALFVAGVFGAVNGIGMGEAQAKEGEEEEEGQAAKYARLKKKGLEKIARKEDFTLRFFSGGAMYDIMAIRFKGEKSTLFIRTIIGDEVKRTHAFDVERFGSLMAAYEEGGWTIDEL